MMSLVVPLWAFLAVTLPLVLTPGASTAVVLRNSLAGGTRAGLETAVGANAGSLCYGILCAFGFALALRRWPGVWVVLRGAGVAYLAWLGFRSLGRAFNIPAGGRPTEQPRPDAPASANLNTGLQNIRDGFITNAANPAIATFYFLILPQFIPVHAPIVSTALLLTAVHIALAASWHAVWAAAGGTLARTLGSGRPRQALDLAAGVALLALATRMLVG